MTDLTPDHHQHSLQDLLLRVIGPILIMFMVGSLVYLMIEVFYRGPHDGRLRWVFGLFTLATVLVSRIAIEEGLERASLFGFALGVATLITSMRLVDFDYGPVLILEPIVLTLFILVVMWSANRLTWDCTLIDDSRDVSAIGLLDIIKQKLSLSRANEESNRPAKDESPVNLEPGFFNRLFFLLMAGSKNKNTPGLWVLYFSLAAFPIFGLGQWFAQRDPETGYRWVFTLFAVYLGSGLFLLMLTSVLGLDRYLKKRGARMPTVVTRNWLIVGTIFALLIMLAVVMMPRPDLSSQLERSWAFLVSPDRGPSKFAVGNDGKKEGDRPAANQAAEDQDAPAANQGQDQAKKPSGKNGDGKSGKSQSDSKSGSDTGDSQGSSSGSGDSKSGKTSDSKSSSQNKKPSQSEQQKSKSADSNGAKQKPNADKQNQQNAKNKNAKKAAQAHGAKRPDRAANANNRKQQAPERAQQKAAPPTKSPISDFLTRAGRYLTYFIGFFIFVVLIWMFRKELAELWNGLFRKKAKPKADHQATRLEPKKPAPDFASFREPFQSGLVAKWTNAQIIQYTFAALEAWAYQRQHPRQEDQTPFEFATQLAGVNEAISSEAHQLADMHGRCLFGGGQVSRSETLQLEKLWRLMTRESGRVLT